MANSKSAEKRNRQNERRRERNKRTRSRIRTATRRFEEAMTSGDVKAAEQAFGSVESVLDRAAAKGVIPQERASRKIGRLAKRLHQLR